MYLEGRVMRSIKTMVLNENQSQTRRFDAIVKGTLQDVQSTGHSRIDGTVFARATVSFGEGRLPMSVVCYTEGAKAAIESLKPKSVITVIGEPLPALVRANGTGTSQASLRASEIYVVGPDGREKLIWCNPEVFDSIPKEARGDYQLPAAEVAAQVAAAQAVETSPALASSEAGS